MNDSCVADAKEISVYLSTSASVTSSISTARRARSATPRTLTDTERSTWDCATSGSCFSIRNATMRCSVAFGSATGPLASSAGSSKLTSTMVDGRRSEKGEGGNHRHGRALRPRVGRTCGKASSAALRWRKRRRSIYGVCVYNASRAAGGAWKGEA